MGTPTSRVGRPPKGDREGLTVRFPRTHLDTYRAQAAAAGLPVGDYVALVLARSTGLDEPAYLTTNKDQPKLLAG